MARLLRAPLGRRVGPSCQLAVSARGRALLMPWSRQDDCRASGAAEVGWGAARPIGPIDRTPARRIQPYSQLPGRAVRRGRAQRARFPAAGAQWTSRRPGSPPPCPESRRSRRRSRQDRSGLRRPENVKRSGALTLADRSACAGISGRVTRGKRGIAKSLIRIRHIMEHLWMDRFMRL